MDFLLEVFIINILNMNKSQRIYLSTGDTGNYNQDKYIKVRLEQNIETLEFMSLSLGTTDVYQNFNADYGVLVGRVVANGGVGIPNAKISIFIALTDEDAEDKDIYSVYPYKTPRDKNNEGKRYNLLPRVGERNSNTGSISPKQPFGSFPIKEEIVTNPNFLEVYKKYYKYTALTNSAGDYMIFGVPTGTQTVHLSVDITDIGEYSMNPAAMVTNLGYSPNLFTDNNTKIKSSSDLNDLPNIETQEISVDIVPFWGDVENFEIGITRQDFRIRSVLVNTFVVFGSAFTDSDETVWGKDTNDGRKINELNRVKHDAYLNTSIGTKRIGNVTEKIYYYPAWVSDEDIDNGIANPKTEMSILDPSEYSAYKRDGDFVFIINCNRNKVITNELGNEVLISNDSTNGVFTKFRGFITLEITTDDIPTNGTSTIGNNTVVNSIRYKLKFPQCADRDCTFTKEDSTSQITNTQNWRKQSFTFESSKYYSFARFHGTVYCTENPTAGNDGNAYEDTQLDYDDGFWGKDYINYASNYSFWNSGIIMTNDMVDGDDDYDGNDEFEFINNSYVPSLNDYKSFGAQWLNLSVYLPHAPNVTNGYSYIKYVRTFTNFTRQKKTDDNDTTENELNRYYVIDNTQEIAAGDFNTKGFARSDLHWTDIVEVPLSDIQTMKETNKKGFKDNDPTLPNILTVNNYRNGLNTPTNNSTITWGTPCPLNGGKYNGYPTNPPDPRTYFYKGLGDADCIEYLYLLGIVS